jgi:hypothetical protein
MPVLVVVFWLPRSVSLTQEGRTAPGADTVIAPLLFSAPALDVLKVTWYSTAVAPAAGLDNLTEIPATDAAAGAAAETAPTKAATSTNTSGTTSAHQPRWEPLLGTLCHQYMHTPSVLAQLPVLAGLYAKTECARSEKLVEGYGLEMEEYE